jgi:transposase
MSVRTLPRWWHGYQARRLAGLRRRWAPGRTAKIPEALAPEILPRITPGPSGCGLDRAHWTYEALVASLYQRHGLAVSATTMRVCCHRHGVRP